MKDIINQEKAKDVEIKVYDDTLVRYKRRVIEGQLSQCVEVHRFEEDGLTMDQKQAIIVGLDTKELILIGESGRRTAVLSKSGLITRVDAVAYDYDLGIGMYGSYRFERDEEIPSWLIGVRQEAFVGPDDQSGLSEKELHQVVEEKGLKTTIIDKDLVIHDGLVLYLGMRFDKNGVLEVEDEIGLDQVNVNRQYEQDYIKYLVMEGATSKDRAESLLMATFRLKNQIFHSGLIGQSKIYLS